VVRSITIDIPGTPQEQSRPRVIRRGNHAGLADTAQVRDYKAYAKALISLACQEAGWEPLDGAVGLEVLVLVQRPQSWPKRRRHAVTKPDLDNYLKLVSDCLEGLAYTNDSRVVQLAAAKRLATRAPGVRIVVYDAEEGEAQG
jgi:Holliday junction resolvase RusA-like endonuclease